MSTRISKKRIKLALDKSIVFWRQVVDGKVPSSGCESCPLCALFADDECRGCPVSAVTGRVWCIGSPYPVFAALSEEIERSYWARTPVARQAALAEFNFLKAIRRSYK